MLLVLPCSYNVTGQKYNKAYYQAHVSPILLKTTLKCHQL
jgi:hypothetical protein